MGGRRKKKVSTLAEELHKPVRRKFKRRRVLVNGIDKIWAADLADMQAFSKFNRGVKYLLAVIDVFSKYGWLIPLKDKTGKSVASALKTIFKERKPEKMWVDKGKAFYNKDVKELIELYSTENEEKSSVVERWIRTMKENMWKYFTTNSTNVYVYVLPDLVRECWKMQKEIKNTIFRGVFLLDTLPKKPNKKECGIVNFDKSVGPGTHWVAWYKNGKTKIYFDSYGVQPPLEVIKYLGSPIQYNTDQLQPADEVFCGNLCLYVLKELSMGNEFQNILNKFF